MKSDIKFHPVEGVTLAIAKKKNELNGLEWHVYIINKKNVPLENVLITSKGYGEQEGEKKTTSTLRHMIERLEAASFAIVEPIDPTLFELTNEFWVSYYIDGHIYDKKFIFVPGSITDKTLSLIKEIELEGVLHS
ncbi:hypothetical protein QQ008_19220 [Fulvivirgaceae bacterium BMA10]|uniref:Uncharacterized protein n=1 Tax=Splendidivirga corallicola TaxID=3051826 RepID=A0ABT8KRY2_9BACT|nr:hypothetical protein [Fulvivirgaceae bacterium BMA10]